MNGLTIALTVGSTVVFLGTAQDIEGLERKYAVAIEQGWTNYSVVTYAGNNYKEVASAPLSLTPAELGKMLEGMQDRKLSELEKRFGIKISKDGGKVDQSSITSLNEPARNLRLREPKLGELYKLEYALEHSVPSQLSKNSSKGMHVYFLDEKNKLSTNDWGFASGNKAAIFLEPRSGVSFGRTLEETIMHQFAHNSAYRLGWNPHEPWRWSLAPEMGWVFAGQPHLTSISLNGHSRQLNTEAGRWVIQSSEGANYLYKPYSPDSWIRVDKNLNPLDDQGKIASEFRARKFDSEKIWQYAKVRPATSEFDTPAEVFADALSMFRFSRDARAELLLASPSLYKVVREHDQKELDHQFGVGVKVRGLDGKVLDATAETLETIRKFEEGRAS